MFLQSGSSVRSPLTKPMELLLQRCAAFQSFRLLKCFFLVSFLHIIELRRKYFKLSSPKSTSRATTGFNSMEAACVKKSCDCALLLSCEISFFMLKVTKIQMFSSLQLTQTFTICQCGELFGASAVF